MDGHAAELGVTTLCFFTFVPWLSGGSFENPRSQGAKVRIEGTLPQFHWELLCGVGVSTHYVLNVPV